HDASAPGVHGALSSAKYVAATPEPSALSAAENITDTAALFHPAPFGSGEIRLLVVGATPSMWYGPALIPTTQLPATSQTGPEAIVMAEPLIELDRLNVHEAPAAALQGVATPDVASVAPNAAVGVP